MHSFPNGFPFSKLVFYGYFSIAIFIIWFFDGTGDAGDSINHFLFAKYAPQHPALYFDHWAKPLFVLLASPFAQFGFVGMKIFNALTTLFTLYFTFRIAQGLEIKNSILAAVFLLFAPLYFSLTFSGLTEPLFALFLSVSLHFVLQKKIITAAIIVSFLPFIRTEGLLFIAVFGFYLLLSKQWKILPWLLLGHLVYSIAGFFIYHDFLWIFTKIPYSRLSSTYGSGTFFHFVEKLIYVVGIPFYILFWLGILAVIWKAIQRKICLETGILVFLGFLVFFFAHSLFWYFGIFNSMGLIRVFIAVLPLMGIISLLGFNLLTEEFLTKWPKSRRVFQLVFILYLIIFPFTHNPAAIHWDKEMRLNPEQIMANQMVQYIKQTKGHNYRSVHAHPYLSFTLNEDPFDNKKHLDLSQNYFSKAKKGDLIVWENWFAVVERGVLLQHLEDNPKLTKRKTIASKIEGSNSQFVLFEVIK